MTHRVAQIQAGSRQIGSDSSTRSAVTLLSATTKMFAEHCVALAATALALKNTQGPASVVGYNWRPQNHCTMAG